MKWRTQDWIWVLTFALFAHGMALVYKDWLMQIVSYGSTFVSISLAAVAIYISVREATKGDGVKDEINLILGELREKINQMDTKINKFDSNAFNQVKDQEIDTVGNEILTNIESQIPNEETLSKQEIISIVKEQVGNAKNDLKSSLNISSEDIKNQKYYNSSRLNDHFKELVWHILDKYNVGDIFSLDDIYFQTKMNNYLRYSKKLTKDILEGMVNEGILVSVTIDSYKLNRKLIRVSKEGSE